MKIDVRRIRRLFRYRKNREKGQTFAIVLVLLLVVSAIIVSSLTYVGATIVTNKTYINNTESLYAAEAGIQDGIWNTLNQTTGDLSLMLNTVTNNPNLTPPDNPNPSAIYTDYDFNKYGWTYQLPNPVNTYAVDVTLTNAWVPLIDDNNPSWIPSTANPLPPDGDITPPSLTKASGSPPLYTDGIMNDTSVAVVGGVTTPGFYKINISYKDTTPSTPFYITSIGCWLPQGFTYNNGSSNLQGICSSEQVPLPCAGNQAVVWTFSSGITFSDLLTSLHESGSIAITFNYTASNPSKPYPDALAWITDTPNESPGHNDNILGGFQYPYTWDGAIKVYDMISDAGNTEIEAFVPQSSARTLGSAIAGDYVAIGNSLLTMSTYNSSGVRTNLLSHSSATVDVDPTGNKAGSDVEAAYLYWSGWLNSSSHALGNSYGTLVNISINGHQVCFAANGKDYTQGTNPIGSTMNQTELINITGNKDYSYSCYKDVTALVRGELKAENKSIFSDYLTVDVGPGTGSPAPSGGCKLADTGGTGQEWAYAGWSLVIIYSGPTTLGHQLYLYDTFTYAAGNLGHTGMGSDIDPTQNTAGPGGLISGFVVPQKGPLEQDTDNAATLTAFVGEGDFCYSGDFIALNAPQIYWSNPLNIPNSYKLWDGITLAAPTLHASGDPGLPNNDGSRNNVWNSYPQTGTGLVDGVDIKTFNITWGRGLINPGDSSARIDLPTQVDAWNLVYMILSFRSSVTSGGSISYLIRKKHTP